MKECEGEPRFVALPEDGMSASELDVLMKRWSEKDEKHWMSGQVSGAVYHGGEEVIEIAVSGA